MAGNGHVGPNDQVLVDMSQNEGGLANGEAQDVMVTWTCWVLWLMIYLSVSHSGYLRSKLSKVMAWVQGWIAGQVIEEPD